MPKHPPRIYLSDVRRDCINLRIIYWYYPANYWEFADFGGRVICRILEAFKAEGIRIARPETTNYLALDGDKPMEVKSS